VADVVAFGLQGLGDGPERFSLNPQGDNLANSLLLGLIRDEISALAAPETEGNLSAEIPAPRLLIRLHLPNALADAIPLRLCKGGGDGEEQLTQAIPAMSPPRFEQVELYAPRLEAFDDLERIEGAVASAPRRRAGPSLQVPPAARSTGR
jgi:hypothetical protein